MRKGDAKFCVDGVEFVDGPVYADQTKRGIKYGQNALSLAERVPEQDAGASVRGVVGSPCVDLIRYRLWVRPAKDGKCKGALGDEGVTRHEFERFAGAVRCNGVRCDFVVAADAADVVVNERLDSDLR